MHEETEDAGVQLEVSPADIEAPPIDLPDMTYAAALVAYKFMMTGMVARLYLFLHGELDKEIVEFYVERINEKNKVFKDILVEKIPPLKAIYDFLIAEEILEDQKLGDYANEFLLIPDKLQFRVVDEDDEQETVEAEEVIA